MSADPENKMPRFSGPHPVLCGSVMGEITIKPAEVTCTRCLDLMPTCVCGDDFSPDHDPFSLTLACQVDGCDCEAYSPER